MTVKTKEKNKGGRPTKFTPQQFREVVEQYIAYCNPTAAFAGRVPTITGFAVFANVSADLVEDYRKNAKFSGIVKKLYLHCEDALVSKVINDNKPVGGIFLLKAKYGYQEAATKLDVKLESGVVHLPLNPDKR